MKLTLANRVQLASVLPSPEYDSFLTFKLLKGIRTKVFLSGEEIEKYDVQNVADTEVKTRVHTTWNEEGVKAEFDIEFSEVEMKYLNKTLSELSAQNKLPGYLFELCETCFTITEPEEVPASE